MTAAACIQLGYDESFEQKLADAIVRAVALVTALASVTALSPTAARSPTAIRKTAESFRRKLMARLRAAVADPLFADFKSRCFHDGDRERGGHG